MNNEIAKWINAQTHWPLGNLATNYVNNYTTYNSLIEYVENVCNVLDLSYIVVDFKNLEKLNCLDYINNILVFNSNEKNVIDVQSVHFVKKITDISEPNYIVILDKINANIEFKTLFYILFAQKFNLLILALFISFLYSLKNLTDPLLVALILFQFVSLILQKQLNDGASNRIVKTFCNDGNSDGDSCNKLKKSSSKILNFFEFSELGIIFFFSIITFQLFHTNYSGNIGILSVIKMSSILGVIFGIYSLLIQIKVKIVCPICMFSIFTIGIHTLYYGLTDSLLTFSLNFLSFQLVFIPFILLFLILDDKILTDFKSNYFKSNFNFKNLYFSNYKLINNSFLSTNDGHNELLSLSIRPTIEYKHDQQKLVSCISIDCPSCVTYLNNIRSKNQSNFNYEIIFQISIKNGKIENNPIYYSVISLALIFKSQGFTIFVDALNQFVNSGFSENSINKYLKNEIQLNDKRNTMGEIIKKQNVLMEELNINSYPYIFLNQRIIPTYIDPIYFNLFKY